MIPNPRMYQLTPVEYKDNSIIESVGGIEFEASTNHDLYIGGLKISSNHVRYAVELTIHKGIKSNSVTKDVDIEIPVPERDSILCQIILWSYTDDLTEEEFSTIEDLVAAYFVDNAGEPISFDGLYEAIIAAVPRYDWEGMDAYKNHSWTSIPITFGSTEKGVFDADGFSIRPPAPEPAP